MDSSGTLDARSLLNGTYLLTITASHTALRASSSTPSTVWLYYCKNSQRASDGTALLALRAALIYLAAGGAAHVGCSNFLVPGFLHSATAFTTVELAKASLDQMDGFLLLGDSIVQQSFSQERGFGFGAALSDAYVRRLDVINRGLSGYNTKQALRVLPLVIPNPQHISLKFLVVFFGANDARLPDTPGPSQTISIDEYGINLSRIVTHESVRAHHDVRVILITPPPIDERLQEEVDKAQYSECTSSRRTAENTKRYAEMAKWVAGETGVACLDLWQAMMNKAGWEGSDQTPLPGSMGAAQNAKLVEWLRDGLHFSPAGYKFLFDELLDLITRSWPDQTPEKLPSVFPAWDDSQSW